MNALNYGFLSVKAGVQENAVCAGSERMSAWMTADKFNHEAENFYWKKDPSLLSKENFKMDAFRRSRSFLLENKPRENES
jgi:3-oxoacyl-[acyl-carrier-protein] synthase-3